MIQHPEDSIVLENNRRRKRKESEPKIREGKQIFVPCKVKLLV